MILSLNKFDLVCYDGTILNRTSIQAAIFDAAVNAKSLITSVPEVWKADFFVSNGVTGVTVVLRIHKNEWIESVELILWRDSNLFVCGSQPGLYAESPELSKFELLTLIYSILSSYD